MEEKLYNVDKAISYARHTMEQLESTEWFAGDLLETLESAKHNGMDYVPVEEALSKVRGIFHLMHNANLELNKHLEKAQQETDEIVANEEK